MSIKFIKHLSHSNFKSRFFQWLQLYCSGEYCKQTTLSLVLFLKMANVCWIGCIWTVFAVTGLAKCKTVYAHHVICKCALPVVLFILLALIYFVKISLHCMLLSLLLFSFILAFFLNIQMAKHQINCRSN